jgi:hypothetical protein
MRYNKKIALHPGVVEVVANGEVEEEVVVYIMIEVEDVEEEEEEDIISLM